MQLSDLWCNSAFTVTSAREKVTTNNNWDWRERLLITRQLLSRVCPTYFTGQKSALFIASTLAPWHRVDVKNLHTVCVLKLKGHLRPRTRTCSPCRCQSLSLWAEGETEKNRKVSIRMCRCSERLINPEKNLVQLTPLVERATKCLATAAFCWNIPNL